jgi:hypothetical protein
MKHRTLAFSCGARSPFKLKEQRLLEKHAIAPSAARLCYAAPLDETTLDGPESLTDKASIPAVFNSAKTGAR